MANTMAMDYNEFQATKAGVKGLVDAGVQKVPDFFVHPKDDSMKVNMERLNLPTIDFQGGFLETGSVKRKEVVEEIRKAARDWGFFQIVNHGVPLETMDAMLEATKRFHEQPTEKKMHLYSTEWRNVKFNSNPGMREDQRSCWKDMLTCVFQDDQFNPDEIPTVCREEVQEYVKCMIQLRQVIAELLSEALGLKSDYLSHMECMKSETLTCLYYPKCPEAEKTVGVSKHTDATFFTLLMQDSIGGLQIVHNNQWIDIPPARGAFIANIGDLMQVISNNKFTSVEHRVLTQVLVPRVSVACFFTPSTKAIMKPFAPIKEIISEEDPALYGEVMFMEYVDYYKATGLAATALPHFRIR